MTYTVGEVARLARVSVRALHHYDEIGLLRPSGRSEAGYRKYTQKDLERLQQVLFFRELGFKLEEILRILSDPGFDRKKTLIAQRALLAEKAERATALVGLIDRTIQALERDETMSDKDMFAGADAAQHERYEEEAEQRWGSTEAYAESKRRTSRYSREDWKKLGLEAGEIVAAFAAAAEAGIAPSDARAMDIAEAHRAHIDRWFYPCTRAMHAGLGEMYVADPRFTAVYDARRPGLAQYIRDAMAANAART